MSKHVLLSTNHPHNWESIIKILNAHQPDKVTFCHFVDEGLDESYCTPPSEFKDWLEGMWDIEFKQINMYFGERPTFEPEDEIILDIRSGATFSQIMIKRLAPDGCQVWCTSFEGDKCTRIDVTGSFGVKPLGPIKKTNG